MRQEEGNAVWHVWTNLPNSPERHGWAFYYWLKRQGEHVEIVSQNGRDGPLTIRVRKQRMTFYIKSGDARFEVVGYNGHTGQAELQGPVAKFYVELNPERMERLGWRLIKEDGSHAQLKELQA